MSMLGDGAGVVLEISVLSSQLCSKTCNLFKKKKKKEREDREQRKGQRRSRTKRSKEGKLNLSGCRLSRFKTKYTSEPSLPTLAPAAFRQPLMNMSVAASLTGGRQPGPQTPPSLARQRLSMHTHTYVYIHIIFHILVPYWLLQNIE